MENQSITEVDTLDRLDEEYHEYRVLRQGTPVNAEITAVGIEDVGGEVLFHLSITENKSRTIAFDVSDYDDLRKLERVHESIGLELSPDLSSVKGESINVRFSDEDLTDMYVTESDIDARVIDKSRSEVKSYFSVVKEEYLVSYNRQKQFQTLNNHGVVSSRITDVSANHAKLQLILDFCGEPTSVSVSIPEEIPGSRYEQIVEEVGRGSVKQIEGEYVYFVRKEKKMAQSNYSFPEEPVVSISDKLSLWWGFPDKTTAKEASRASHSATVTEANIQESKNQPQSTGDLDWRNVYDGELNAGTAALGFIAVTVTTLLLEPFLFQILFGIFLLVHLLHPPLGVLAAWLILLPIIGIVGIIHSAFGIVVLSVFLGIVAAALSIVPSD